MNEPGGLDELSAAGRAAWTGRVEECIGEVLSDLALDGASIEELAPSQGHGYLYSANCRQGGFPESYIQLCESIYIRTGVKRCLAL
jgi:hypothetical protein